MCVCVCLSVQPEISETGGHIAALLTTSWRALPGELHKLLFEPIRCVVRENKPLKFFASYSPNSRACTVKLQVTLGTMNLAHYLTSAGTFSKVHAHYITGTIVASTDIWQIMHTCLNDVRFQWKRLLMLYSGVPSTSDRKFDSLLGSKAIGVIRVLFYLNRTYSAFIFIDVICKMFIILINGWRFGP